MSILDLFNSGEHSRNLSHFANLAAVATSDEALNADEIAMLERLARKLDITQAEFEKVMEDPFAYPIVASHETERRYERLFDLFRMVYVDHKMDAQEKRLVQRYATGLGFGPDDADRLIARSTAIFEGRISFEDYQYLLKSE